MQARCHVFKTIESCAHLDFTFLARIHLGAALREDSIALDFSETRSVGNL